eukprot:CAMPEP_0175908210 /NCGR_PEP_ID=MMETSP0108-20121206/6473_1 /TAXON_ID=195067 ORGANISM="Goniomonas pacifica, Strain CCMP1869" /NCGR_SAMPLE_ID=MMETSP0108 /ASSEMBLY_ACC=CAM_ASM_000204 /LENGTH=223 /DNA_ID=CAMNT_0017230243 /DNA_START=108 /DNA_END=776 /DNA_ORIENTATION=-
MTNLVEDVILQEEPARLLYLTNAQVKLFSDATVPKMLRAFGMEKQPKLVIHLGLSSGHGFIRKCAAHTERNSDGTFANPILPNSPWLAGVQSVNCPEDDDNDEELSYRRLSQFVEEVLLPMAMATDAIILCEASDECELSSALATILKVRKIRNPPFTVVTITRAPGYARRLAVDDQSHVSSVCMQSRNWRQGLRLDLEASSIEYKGIPPDEWLSSNEELLSG